MALTDKLSAIGTAIRNKTGKTALMTLDEMPTEIASISTGADIPAELLTWDWAIDYIDYDGKWDKFIETYGSRITTTNLFTTYNAFTNSKLATIPIVFNMSTTQLNHQCGSTFWGCQDLTTCPTINNLSACSLHGFFGLCRRLTSITVPISWEWANSETSSGSVSADGIFQDCSRLRSIHPSWFDCDFLCDPSSSFYYNGFDGCKSLDELVGLPVFTKSEWKEWTNNAFENFISGDTINTVCNRLKNVTFKTNNGTPLIAKWANQHISFGRVGTFYSESEATNLGFTEATRITDDTTYQALKNNPDSWTTDLAYSRYNHDSAVATINSLPDTSAFVTQYQQSSGEPDASNVLQFGGFSTMGASTDGGAINTLTEAEIAVATSKGWTVTM